VTVTADPVAAAARVTEIGVGLQMIMMFKSWSAGRRASGRSITAAAARRRSAGSRRVPVHSAGDSSAVADSESARAGHHMRLAEGLEQF
jgi:hypothetical protein